MGEAGLRELRQQASELVRRAEAGEVITVTVSGRPVAELTAVRTDRTWRRAADLAELFAGPADTDWHHDRDGVDQQPVDPFVR